MSAHVADKDLTPARRQYLAFKKKYPNAILFFRMGDFYETFDDDARLVARELEIVLTGREMGKAGRVPLAGIPHHAAEGYVARLIAKGYKVAICEQVGPVPTTGIVEREIVRVVTPGTLVEPGLLSDKRNNYLAALVVAGPERAALAYADVSTGEFAATEMTGPTALQTLLQELGRLQPAECLVDAGKLDSDGEEPLPGLSALSLHLTPFDSWRFSQSVAQRALLDQFQAATLDGFGLQGLPHAVEAAGALLQYVQETQPAALQQLSGLSAYAVSAFMLLDAATRRNLELTQSTRNGTVKGSLLGVLDLTRTPMGGRLLRRWLGQPLIDVPGLQARQQGVARLHQDTALRLELAGRLGKVADLERLLARTTQHMASPRDLVSLAAGLRVVKEMVIGRPAADEDTIGRLLAELDPCHDVASLIEQAIVVDPPATISNGGVIRPGFSAELDGLLASSKDARQWIAGLERVERERTGIKSLKVGYNKVFGYYIEVSNANVAQAPASYIRKQTLVGAERYITPDLKEYESLVLNAQERMVELEAGIFRQVCDQVAGQGRRVLKTAAALAQLDVLAALAEVAVRNNYVQPILDDGDTIDIRAGRHPVVENMVGGAPAPSLAGEPFVPNDAHLCNRDAQIIILTGPNMAGKSTYLRQVALIVLMAQIGSFVPAREATIGLVDRIFTRVGAQDDIATGQSTFMVEMVETAIILNHATARSLIILDEIGRGTSTYDGLAIARAVVEYVHNHPRLGAKTIFATHYHELVELAKSLPRVRNFNVAVAEEGERVIFLRRIVPGGADRSYGIHVAQLAGLPRTVVQRAQEVLDSLEKDEQGRGRKERLRRQLASAQLSLFADEQSPVLQELRALHVAEMSPLEAINKLYDLQQQAQQEKP